MLFFLNLPIRLQWLILRNWILAKSRSNIPPHKLWATKRSGSITNSLDMKASIIWRSFKKYWMLSFLNLIYLSKSWGIGFPSSLRIMLNVWNLSPWLGPSWFMLVWIRQEIIAISLVLFADLAVLKEKQTEVRGGKSYLLRSSNVTSAFLGLSMTNSYMHQVFLNSWIFWGFLMVIQHGPLIFLLRMNSSNID